MTTPNLEEPKAIKNVGISDLWFNWDHTNSKKYGKDGMFAGFDLDLMAEDAKGFLAALEAAGAPELPTPTELIEDLHYRM